MTIQARNAVSSILYLYIFRYCFASGADEKIVRVFEAPRNFIENLGSVSKVDVRQALKNKVNMSSNIITSIK